jgi:predicted ATPase
LLAGDVIAGNLPRQLTSFIGHEHDLVAIPEALANFPVVTLTGVGGVGKTRLALEVAARVAPGFRDGAWVCRLEGVRHGDAVPDAVLEVFGVDPGQGGNAVATLIRFLRSKHLVLVLDNCEHLLRPTVRLTNEIVDECSEVKILATSREGLGVTGERIFAVASLDLPSAMQDADAIAQCEAVRLFVARAQLVRADFALDASNAAAVAQVCRRLDGVPLAIELAAARVGLLTATELSQRLDHRFRVLTGSERGAVERHQTLRAAIDWSYDLLDETERHVLDRLSVFAGGFTLTAVEAVAASEGIDAMDVLELLAGLVAKSLVVADTHGTHARYQLLETIRQYAEERLDERGEAAAARDAHARYFAAFTETATAGLASADEPEWIRLAVAELDNIRAALTWAIETKRAETAMQFFAPRPFGFSELERLLTAAASAALTVPGITIDRRLPTVLALAAMQASSQADGEAMRRYVDEALAAQQRLNEVIPDVIAARTWAAIVDGRVTDYQEYQQEAITAFRDTHNQERLAVSLAGSAMAKALKGENMALAVAEVDEAVALAEGIAVPSIRASVQATAAFVLADVQPERARTLMDDTIRRWALVPGSTSPIHSILGDVAERLGDHQLALQYFVIGMDEHHWLGQTELAGRMLRRLGLALVEHDPEPAAIIVGAGMARSQASTLTERVNQHHRERVAVLEASLGAERCRSLMSQGAAMADNDAVALAHTTAERALTNLAAEDQQHA